MRPILSRRVLPSCSLVEEECSYKKLTWVIKAFCSIQSKKYYSDKFVVSGCRWRLLAFPKGNGVEWLSLYLEVAGESLPDGWKRHAAFNFRIVNHISERFSQVKGTQHWFDATTACDWGFISMIPLNVLHDQTAGFLVNGELKIVAEVNLLEVIGKLDVPDESEEATKSLDQLEDDDFPEVSNFEEASSAKEFVDVSSFQVLPSQVESLSRIFERHPDIASAFRPKNQHLRSAYMSVLLSLIETLCQSTQELSKDDLKDAYATLAYLTDSGLNLDWLEEKLKEMSEKKQKQEAGERRVQEIKEELKDLNEKCLNLEAQLEKEKGDVSMARAPLSFDDVV